MTTQQKKALRAGLAEALFELIDANEEHLIADAQWKTDDLTGPSEYWTKEVCYYLRQQLRDVVRKVQA